MSVDLTRANAQQLRSLTHRAERACVVLRNHPLPPDCVPRMGDLGLDSDGAVRLLHVRRGITYTGADDEVRHWIRTGSKTFRTWGALADWVRVHLAPPEPPASSPSDESDAAEGAITSSTEEPAGNRPLTDLERVQSPDAAPPSKEDIATRLRREVAGQDRAVDRLAALASRHAAKVRPRRPATALLIGPTGVGKTLAAQTLADLLGELTSGSWHFLRLDMNEFSQEHTVARLFGSPPGYIGYNDGADLAAHLRRHPRSVVLFDEIDKAHPRLWHALMNLMDAGRLAASVGSVDARASILLFTSNKDADLFVSAQGGEPEGTATLDDRLRDLLRDRGFPAEIVARIATLAVFTELVGDVRTELVLRSLQRVVASYGLELTYVEPPIVSAVLARMPRSELGVRDLEYHLDDQFGSLLADHTRAVGHGPVELCHGQPPSVVRTHSA